MGNKQCGGRAPEMDAQNMQHTTLRQRKHDQKKSRKMKGSLVDT